MIRHLLGAAALVATLATAALPAAANTILINNKTTTGGAWITLYYDDVLTGKKIVKAFCAEPDHETVVKMNSTIHIARAQIEEPNCGKREVANFQIGVPNSFDAIVTKNGPHYDFKRTK